MLLTVLFGLCLFYAISAISFETSRDIRRMRNHAIASTSQSAGRKKLARIMLHRESLAAKAANNLQRLIQSRIGYF